MMTVLYTLHVIALMFVYLSSLTPYLAHIVALRTQTFTPQYYLDQFRSKSRSCVRSEALIHLFAVR